MIKFTELRVKNGKLIITAEVRDLEMYDNGYIEDIIIDSDKTFKSNDYKAELHDPIYRCSVSSPEKVGEGHTKVRLVLESAQLSNVDMNKTMFFVFAIGAGAIDYLSIPCGADEPSIGVTFSLCPIYNETMQYVKEVENSCELPKAFINMILQFKAIQYSINSGHFTQAIKYYNRFYKTLSVGATSPCGCHG